MTAPIDVRERLELCDLLLELGPDAPTLCEGWTTADLAAHLVLREHFHRWSDAQRAVEKANGLAAMVARLRAGAPLIRPDGQRRRYGSGNMATLSGPATELVLYLSGRGSAAQVTLGGAADAVAAVEGTKLAI
jgi:hypothetical protein